MRLVDEHLLARWGQLLAEIASLGPCLPGSLVERRTRCGTAGCRCHGEPAQLHGPYPSWTRRVGNRTVTRTLSAEQAERCRPLFENAKRLRALVVELEQLSALIVESSEGWAASQCSTSRRRHHFR